ncbi:MAG: tetratricopeptide repeat protein, partial [Caulobacteraceae bacterium]|nr:tetratricopeptide repeat protein [Caulobacteraceae bacterium]
AEAPTASDLPRRGGRIAIAAVAALAPLVAIAVYVKVGSPQFPDQPFAKRLQTWRAADPASLTPEQMAAVLELVAQQRPNDPQVFYYLARAQMAENDSYSAIRSLERSIDLDPRNADLWTTLAEADMAQAGSDDVPADAVKAFQHAAQIDPAAPTPRYYLARAQIAGGDVAGGLAAWRALDRDLPPSDPRRQALDQDIAVVAQTHALPRAAVAQAGPAPGQQAFIRSMVAALAARLQAQPNDPEGWARLIRSYAVLGDTADHDAALARARALFKDRPGDLSRIDQASTGPQ